MKIATAHVGPKGAASEPYELFLYGPYPAFAHKCHSGFAYAQSLNRRQLGSRAARFGRALNQ
jgi:hypothetical protein